MSQTKTDTVRLFRTVYKVLSALGDEQPEVATSAIASIRLLLIKALAKQSSAN